MRHETGQTCTRMGFDCNINVWTRVTNCLCAHERIILVFICFTKITLEWALCHESTYIISFLHNITNPYATIKMTIFTHRLRVPLAGFTFGWWRHNWLLIASQINYATPQLIRVTLDVTIVLGLHKSSLQATIDHHGPPMYSVHYTTSIDCCQNIPL